MWTRLSACSVDQREYFGALTIVLKENSHVGSLRPSQNCQLNFLVIHTTMLEMSAIVDKNFALLGRQKKLFWCIDFSYSGK